MRCGAGSPAPRRVALSDSNCIDTPAVAGDAAVTAHPPAQYKGTVRQIYRRGEKPARVTGPRFAARKWIATASADRPIVTAVDKRATCGNNVLKRKPSIKADFKHTAVKPVLQVEVVAKGKLRAAGVCDKRNIRRKKLLVADRGWIIDECSIGQCIGRWRRHSGIGCHPCGARPTGRQRRWRNGVELLQEKYDRVALYIWLSSSLYCYAYRDSS